MKCNIKLTVGRSIFVLFGYVFITVMAIFCVLPFILIISGSLTPNDVIAREGFGLLPKGLSFSAYSLIFKYPEDVFNAYKISIIVTGCGTLLLLFLNSMAAYVLSRKDYKYRNVFSFYMFFTTIFSGGLVPWYILMVRFLRIKEHPILAMILPPLFSFFYIIIMRSFMSDIPAAISESAKMDGANDFLIYIRLILPLSKPVLATIGLFGALDYWNDWFNAMLFVDKSQYFPLQYYLYRALNSIEAISRITSGTSRLIGNIPTESFKLAMTVVATGPIVILYPCLQKYFIKGLTIGAVKG